MKIDDIDRIITSKLIGLLFDDVTKSVDFLELSDLLEI